VALCFGISMPHGPALALTLGAFFAGSGSLVSFSRLAARPIGQPARDVANQAG
jgi:DHA2 family multidrug resistance protein-like MFS transporter